MNEALDDLLESDQKFRSQFDRNSENFHQGDPRPVPIGGQRVPEGMSENPEVPIEESKVPPSAEYERVMSTRTFLQDFKKTVSLICPAVEARLRSKLHKIPEEREKLVIESSLKIEETLQNIRDGQVRLAPVTDLTSDYSEELSFIYSNSLNDYSSKEEYGEYMLKVSNFTKKIFKDITRLLQVIKDLKKKA